MIGPGTLVNLLLGRYHRPVAEDRIFMFLDLNDSTAIAPLRGKVEALRVDGRRR
jgi:adenylate cyclase